ncbi:MAG: discoidin domain-containing protein, partial [Phycisphaeraceae bacterium]|nr:discoidin domain-containing protein [Phycisphaeraceae bacterium]
MSRTLLICAFLCGSFLMTTAQGASIIWVDEGAADSFPTWQALLEGAGHTVTQMSDMRTLDQGKIDAMNAADLVIVSRDSDSGNYDDGEEIGQWNGLTVPLIQTSVYLIRSSRWLWVDDTGTPGVTDDLTIAEDHSLFKGVGQAGDSLPMVTSLTNLSGTTDAGNGQILATHADGRLWIAYWEAEVEFYAGAGQMGAAPRMFFAAGLNENSADKGNMNLTEAGQQIFLNAIAFMTGGISDAASDPSPADATGDVIRDSVLSWIPNEYPGTHDVYFGTNFDDVNTMTVPTTSGLNVNSFDPGRLEFGQTYFWRVDEVNASPDKTVFTGNVWSFTAEPHSIQIPGDSIVVTASSSSNEFSTPDKTIDGSGLGVDDTHAMNAESMWFTASVDLDPWIQYEFNDIKKLDVMKVWNSNGAAETAIGWGVKDVQIQYSVDGETWDVLAETSQFSRAPGSSTYNQYDEIDFGGAAAKVVRFNIQSNWGGILMSYGLSEVQLYSIPATARTPEPASGSVDVLPNAVVTWRAGRAAAQHTIYMGTDQDEVADGLAPSVTSSTNSLDLSSLDLQLGETYYWRVDEVNEAEAVSVWAGPVWSLSVVDALTVDDFDSYSNKSPDRPFQAWLDGFGYSADDFFPVAYGGNGTGAGIGHDIWSLSSPHYDGEIMETSSTLSGSGQSMPFYYGNSGGTVSETQHTFAVPQDWTVGGAKTLVIAFRGTVDNTGSLYVKINNTKVTFDGDASSIRRPIWTLWAIDLAAIGTSVTNITEMAIGVDGGSASGMVLIDDIQLHPESFSVPTSSDITTPGDA